MARIEKPRRGGFRPNSGRKPSPDSKHAKINARVHTSLKEVYVTLGGTAWLEKQLRREVARMNRNSVGVSVS